MRRLWLSASGFGYWNENNQQANVNRNNPNNNNENGGCRVAVRVRVVYLLTVSCFAAILTSHPACGLLLLLLLGIEIFWFHSQYRAQASGVI